MRFRPLLARSTVAKARETRSAELLTNYLVELDRRGWDLDEFVGEHPEMSVALADMLRTADYVRRAAKPVPSDAFRQRSRRRLAAWTARQAPRRRWYRLPATWRPYRPLLAPVAAGLLIVFGLGGAWSASASALPNSPLYPAKLAIERAELFTAIGPDRRAEVHLAIAHERLREAGLEQEQGDMTAAQELIVGSDNEVARAQAVVRSYTPSMAVATAVASAAAEVKVERQQMVARVTPLPATTEAVKPRVKPDENPAPTVPAVAQKIVAAVPSPTSGAEGSYAGPASAAPAKADSHHEQPGRSPGNSGDTSRGHHDKDSPGRGDTAGSPAVATPTPTAGPSASAQADQLLQTLVSQAIRGDSSSQKTADQYLAVVRSGRFAATDSDATRAAHRAALEKAIAAAPPSTRPVLESVLEELNHVAHPPGHGPDTQTGAAANPTATPVTASSSGGEKARTGKGAGQHGRSPNATPTTFPSSSAH